jgi:ankyrin repeat protein
LKTFAKSLEWHDEWGMNALLLASYHGTIEVVREFIDVNADLDCANQVHHACLPACLPACLHLSIIVFYNQS